MSRQDHDLPAPHNHRLTRQAIDEALAQNMSSSYRRHGAFL